MVENVESWEVGVELNEWIPNLCGGRIEMA